MTIESRVDNFPIPDLIDKTIILHGDDWRMYHKRRISQSSEHPITYDLSIVIPTRNERDNIRPLLEIVSKALAGVCTEVIFVDDSDDDTPAIIQTVTTEMATSLFHIHLEHRLKGPARAGGLATAVVKGMEIAQAKYVAVIDADLQHPPEQLRVFYDHAIAQDMDMVLASRYIKGGSYEGLDGISRLLISVGLKWTAKIIFPERLLRVSDPLGGFFLLKRSLLDDVTLRPIGYKILLEILMRCQWNYLLEVPYHFQARANGQSKANMKQGIQVLQHIWRLFTEIPTAGRIWKFTAIALVNILVMVMLFLIRSFFPDTWTFLSITVFAVLAFLNLLFINRFIFPAPLKRTVEKETQPFLPRVEGLAEPRTPALNDGQTPARTPSRPLSQSASQFPAPRPFAKLNEPDQSAHGTTQHVTPIEQAPTLSLPTLQAAEAAIDQKPTVTTQAVTVETSQPSTPPIHTNTSSGVRVDSLPTVHMQATSSKATAPEQRRTSTQDASKPRFDLLPTSELRVPTAPLTAIERQQTMPIMSQINQAQARERLLSRISTVFAVLAIGWISYTLPGAWVLLAAVFLGIGIVARNNIEKHQFMTMVFAIAVAISCVDYLTWRFEVTNWAGWWIAFPLLFAETIGAIHTLGFQYTLWPWPKPRLIKVDDPTRFPIFIFIPTVNEGPTILEPTLKGALAAKARYLARYPHGQVTIVVCNDGRVANAPNWQETEELAHRMGVTCVTRTKGGGAKAGNIEHARQLLHATGNALLVIFDADQVAKPNFLLKTVPNFGDATLGWVQTGQYYGNLQNPVSRWSDDQQAMFYNLLCPGKAALNAAFICGTNVVIRAKALDQIGGLPQDSVTEDFSASIALHPHWRSVYLTEVLATGLGPLDLPSYLKQQRRWAIGTLGVLRTHWREIFLPKKGGLRLGQRVQYFLACTHYLCGIRDLIYLLCPMLFILLGVPAVRGSTLDAFLWHFLPYWIASIGALWYAGRGITGLRGIIIGFGSFPVLIESLLSVILQRKIGFTVTSKKRGTKSSWNHLVVYILFLLANLITMGLALRVRGTEQASFLISAMWVVYSILILSGFLWLGFADLRYQEQSKKLQREETNENLVYTSRLHTREQSMRPVWNIALSVLLASFVFTAATFHMNVSTPTPFVLSQEHLTLPYFGVSLPVQLLKDRPPQLEKHLGKHFQIVGRTQDVHDLFDQDWADQLAAQNARPWITLEFGIFGPHGKPPVDASLPAIANGIHDGELKRWAQSIRDYGKPVYLTILLHVDRNWSLSSAVANGGIPQDVPRAWTHVQSVFKAAGATNVAWVWAPADPAHDQQYAPPASTIDLVLLSLISYPNTTWADPQLALSNVQARYPSKPVILEISAAGPADQKAAWLTQVGTTLSAAHGVYALIYHEGSPSLNATHAENEQWSMISDDQSLAAMHQIISDMTKK